jgi:hypothetical protein
MEGRNGRMFYFGREKREEIGYEHRSGGGYEVDKGELAS